jgi:hypothetical protein
MYSNLAASQQPDLPLNNGPHTVPRVLHATAVFALFASFATMHASMQALVLLAGFGSSNSSQGVTHAMH